MNKTHFSETDLLRQFRDVCSAVEYMHTFKSKGGARHYYGANPMVLDDGHHQALLGGQQEQVEGQNDAAKGEKGEIVPWAHRDIKPG
jgi:serine/threonine kinase 16